MTTIGQRLGASNARARSGWSSALAVVAVVAVVAVASPAFAQRVALVRAPGGAQFDEAVAAFKAELGEPVAEAVIDDATTPGALAARIGPDVVVVVAVGARAAQLAAGLDKPVVACMLLSSSAAPSSPRFVKVAVAVPLRAQLEALRGLSPGIKSVGFLYDPRVNADQMTELKAAGEIMKIKVIAKSVSDPRDTPAALDAVLSEANGLLLPADATVVSKAFMPYLVKRAFDKKIPVLTYSESFVRLGLLAALVPSYADNGRIAARITRRLLEGVAPADMQAAAVMKGGLVVNKSAAQKMGLNVPARMLAWPTVVVGE